MYSTTILKKFLWQGRRYTYFKYTILAFFAILPAGCALRALRFGRVSTDFDIRGQERAKGETGKRELFSPSVSCADSSLVRGSGKSRTPEVCGNRELSLPRSAAPTAHSSEGAKGGTPEVCGDREPFSPSVGCADSSLVRGSKGRDADSEGAERTQTGFGKTEKRGLWVPGGSADAGNAGNSGIRERRSWPRIY